MQTLKTPKLTRLTKTAKIQVIKDAIKEGAFDRDEMVTILGVKDRQVRRYLNEIATQDAAANPDSVQILRAICAKNLIKKAALEKLSSTTEAAIVLAGESRKMEVKQELTETKTVNINVKSMLAEYSKLLTTTNGIENQPISPNSAAQQVHPPQTHVETSGVPVT